MVNSPWERVTTGPRSLLKLTDTAPRAPITTGIAMYFRMRQTFATSFFNRDLKIRRRRRQRELQKSNGFDWQNNNVARASRFFVHFFAVTARLRRENANVTFYRGSTQATTKFPPSF